MKQKITIFLSFVFILNVILSACKDEELPQVSGNNKIELTISVDTVSYLFSEISCTLNQNPNFEIEQHGFCWDTINGVYIEKQHINLGILSNENFTCNINELLSNKTYYVKAYLQNGDVIIYSNEINIHTFDVHPFVKTGDITNIKTNMAESGGTVSSYAELFPITQRGVCWAKTTNPTIEDSIALSGTGNGTFVCTLLNLDTKTTYYVRAFAIYSNGIVYGEEKTFKTYSNTITDYDGNEYKIIQIGTQEWMAENLKTTKYQNGDLINDGSLVGDYSSESEPKYWFAYNDDLSNIETYGRLYTWYTVNDSRDICPDGWHIPSDSEWNNLQLYLGMSPNDIDLIGESDNGISAFLKETGTTHWLSPNAGATNSSGFGALPAGYRRRYNKDFEYLGERTFFWTSSAFNDVNSFYRSLSYDSPNITRTYNLKNYGFSVRCIKD